jgi:DNA replication protein DnaC
VDEQPDARGKRAWAALPFLSVCYRRAPRLFAELATARGEGRLSRLLATLERTRLLIIDDWGPEPLTAEQRRDLWEIVDDRYAEVKA